MIKNLEWTTKDGNKMKLSNTPITLGIDMLLISCSKKEKIKIRYQLNDEINGVDPSETKLRVTTAPKRTDEIFNAKPEGPTIRDLTDPKTCSNCIVIYDKELNECPECGSNLTL